MARLARCVFANVPMHIVQRGIDRQPCFFVESDYSAYLGLLYSSARQYGCAVHAYCLMTNHVHLLVTPLQHQSCALMMKKLSQCYVQAVNQRLGRSGTLWEGRFYSCMVKTDDYVLACYRYVELNPVRAGMVATPPEYPWSSYASNAEGAANAIVTTHSVYEGLGTDAHARMRAYKQLCAEAPAPLVVEEIRKATHLGCIAGSVRRRRGRPARLK